jgi:hypothetical protein
MVTSPAELLTTNPTPGDFVAAVKELLPDVLTPLTLTV